MPNRYIRASAIDSESVNALSWQGEVFYRRLLNRADDFGRFTSKHALLRASIFPLQLDRVRETDIPRLLAECEKAGLLFVYTVAAKQYLVLNKWEVGRAKKSEYPAPPDDVCKRMQTYVYTCKHSHANVPDSDTDSDSDPDSDTDQGASAPEIPLPDALLTEAFKAKWAEYVAYRRTGRMKALKPISVSKLWQEISKWGHDNAILSIDESIRNGWQGLFEPKQNRNAGVGQPLKRGGTSTYEQEKKAHGYTL